ncbi:MAG: hypothetical protein IJU64_06570 [Bacilli bacterium]|nr:hypothetical protein [Bacilli bacterium]
MKKAVKIGSIIALMATTSFGAFAGSVAWFTNAVTIGDPDVAGSAVGAYFAYGDGSLEHPYGIRETRHLYNLAWLQYMNYFYERAGFTPENPPHFELAGNLTYNSSSAIKAIPPIGTAAHPFQGVFDGQGYTISGYTFTNDQSKFGYYPKRVTSYTPMTDVGVFGVISGANTVIKNIGLSGNTVDTAQNNSVVGAAVAKANAEVQNIAVDSPKIQIAGSGASSDYGLVGQAASNYEESIQRAKGSVYNFNVNHETFVVQEQGIGEPQWGGSVEMKSMYTRLNDIYSSGSYATHVNGVPTYIYETYDANDELSSSTNQSTITTSNNGSYLKTYNSARSGNSYNRKIGAFRLFKQNGSESSAYIYVSGGHLARKTKYRRHDGYEIKSGTHALSYDPSTTNKWSDKTSGSSAASLWTVPEAGQSGTISTIYNGTTYYLYNNNGTLRVGNTQGSWTCYEDEDGRYYTSGNYQLYYNSGWALAAQTFYISYTSGNQTYYLGVSDQKHASADAYPWVTTTDPDEATEWQMDGTNIYTQFNNKRYYLTPTTFVAGVTSGTSTGYAKYELNNNNGTISAAVTGETDYLTFSNGAFSYGTSGAIVPTIEYWLYDSPLDKTQEVTDRTGTDTIQTYESCYHGKDVSYFPLSVSSKDGFIDSDKTTVVNKYEPILNNTGYVVGGSNYSNGSYSDGWTTYYYYDWGGGRAGRDSTIRVSEYPISGNLTNFDQSSGEFSDVRTITGSGSSFSDHTIGASDLAGFSNKYLKSKGEIEKTLSDDGTNVYGLHFMQASIDAKNKVQAEFVRVLEHTYDNQNYELPANSIDFNLKERGYVNFFAGAYMGGGTVDSFFSLHRVNRTANKLNITSIEEILGVYGDGIENHSYIYKLQTANGIRFTSPFRLDATQNKYEIYQVAGADVPYSESPLTETEFNNQYGSNATAYYNDFKTRYELKFDMGRIKTPGTLTNNQNKAYYFEIPINDGEYCLGSVDNGEVGAYLIYLDIGANAMKDNRTEVYEKFALVTQMMKYPKGVVLVADAATAISAIIKTVDGKRVAKTDLDNADTIAISISTSAETAASIQLIRNSNIVTLSRSGPPSVTLRYQGEDITTQENNNPVTLTPDSTTNYTETRVTYFDTNSSTGSVTKTVISNVNNAANNTWVQTKDGETPEYINVYKGTSYGENKGRLFTDTELQTLNTVGTQNTTCFEYSYTASQDTVIANLDWELIGEIITSGDEANYQNLTSYRFKMTRTGENYVVTVDKANSTISVTIGGNPKTYTSFKYYINDGEVTTGSTVTINVTTPNS